MKRYLNLTHAVVNLHGIRAVTKPDGYGGGFNLSITYKGNHFNITYSTRDLRDQAYNEICTKLEEMK